MARSTTLAFVLLAAAAAGGCKYWDLANDERPNSTQTDAIGDLFEQSAAIATTLDDPSSADESDLVTALTFDHFVYAARPDLHPERAGAAREGTLKALSDCIQASGEGTVTYAVACEVDYNGSTCNVTGSFVASPSGPGTRYDGGATVTGPGCPARSIDVDIVSDHPEEPTQLTGTIVVEQNDGDSSFTGTAEIDIALGECEVPSQGTIDIAVIGTWNGTAIDDDATFQFASEPSCGYVSLE